MRFILEEMVNLLYQSVRILIGSKGGSYSQSFITHGELAQLVECCDRTAEVRDSSSLFSISAGIKLTMLSSDLTQS